MRSVAPYDRRDIFGSFHLVKSPNKVLMLINEKEVKMLYNDLMPTEGQWLCHHGIKGQKWGVRRYQNKDGSLTEEGKQKYLKKIQKLDADKSPKNTKQNRIKKVEMIGQMIGSKKMQDCKNAYLAYHRGIANYWNDVDSAVPRALKNDTDILRYMKKAGWPEINNVNDISQYLGNGTHESRISFILESMLESGDDGVFDLKAMGAFDKNMQESYNRMDRASNNYRSICDNIAREVYGSNSGRREANYIWLDMDAYFTQELRNNKD